MVRHSQPGPEPTTLEAVGDQWHYALVVMQAGEEEVNPEKFCPKHACSPLTKLITMQWRQ